MQVYFVDTTFMIHLEQRLQGFRAYTLGATLQDKILLFGYYIGVRINRKLGKSYFAQPKNISIAYKGIRSNYHIANLDDYRILDEIFLQEQYALTPEHPIKTIVDLGSNVGTSIIYFLAQYPEAHIYGFEPTAYCYDLLVKNIGANKNVTLEKKALDGESGKTVPIYIHPEGHSGSSNFFIEGAEREEVPTISMDSIMEKYSLTSIDILKIDIEGVEYDVLKHFTKLHTVKYILAEVHPSSSGHSVEEFLALCPNFRAIEISKGEFSGKVHMLKMVNQG